MADDAGQPDQREQTGEAAGDGAIRSGVLAGRSLWSAILVLALPILLQQFANAFVTLVDNTLTGHLPEGVALPALDGVGVSSYLGWFIGISMSAIGVGGMAIIARAIGAGDHQQAERALGQAFTFGILLSVIVGAVIWVGIGPLTRLAGLSDEATRYCLQYTAVMALGLPVSGCLMISMTCLNGAGETARPFYIMMVVNVVNIVVSYFLSGVDMEVFGKQINNPLAIDWHVYGIALGSVIGQAVGVVLIVALMVRGTHGLHLRWSEMRPHFEMLRRIVRVGLPGFLDGLGMWAGQLIAVFWLIGKIAEKAGDGGAGLMGSHLIAVRWEAFSFMPGFAMGVAAGTLAGQFLGAGNVKMAGKAILRCTFIGILLMGSAGLVFMIAGETLTKIISSDAVHLEMAPKLLFICGTVQVGFAIAMVIRGGIRGAGDTRGSMLITWFSTYLIRIPLCWLFGMVLDYGLVGVWIGLSVELGLRGFLFYGRFLWGTWKTVKV